MLFRLLLRLAALAVAAGLFVYGYTVLHADDEFVVGAAYHGQLHDPGDPSKAAAAGNLLDVFSTAIGWMSWGIAAIVVAVAVFPWRRLARRRTASG